MNGRHGRAILEERFDALPDTLRAAFATPIPPLPFDPLRIRRFHVTGLGSSEAHARALACWLAEYVALDAHFVSTDTLRSGPPAGAASDALIVFSQGLSPNARFALAAAASWRAIGLVTAVPSHAVADLVGWVVPNGGTEEFGTLVRFAGPATGFVAAMRVAGAIARACGRSDAAFAADPERVAARVADAAASVDRALAPVDDAVLDRPVAFLASGRHATLTHNLQLKWLESLLRPLPPSWDLLSFAHGPFQQACERPTTFLALTREGVAGESELVDRIESMLDPEIHALLGLHAACSGPAALVEHEAQLDALVLRALARRPDVDPACWPGRELEGRIYDLRPEPAAQPRPPEPPAALQRLEAMPWPELSRRLAGSATTAVLPLGATEQHGPHLPYATDTWIADALAERFCARVREAVALPTLPLGCSSEHAGFPGTLSLSADTLAAVLCDVIRCLAADGFARAFIFSAHGGNAATLTSALPKLREVAAPMRVDAFVDPTALAALQHEVAGGLGIEPAAAGHHAGEFETSILAALRPGLVRREALASGRLFGGADAQSLFYPNLRAEAPDGTVGDPTRASAARAEPYLTAWAEQLVAVYRAGDCANQTK
jgi:creatinine amidohydrolase